MNILFDYSLLTQYLRILISILLIPFFRMGAMISFRTLVLKVSEIEKIGFD